MGRIYTKTGDKGETSLFGAGKVPKDHLRVEAYGNVDELNAVVGIIRTMAVPQPLSSWLQKVAEWLFVLGSDLATPQATQVRFPVPRITERYVQQLEEWIDTLEEQLPPLRAFILPGGTPEAAYLHLARTVCRRAERSIVRLTHQEDIGSAVLPFVNRLSDFFFVAARWMNFVKNVPDQQWVYSEEKP